MRQSSTRPWPLSPPDKLRLNMAGLNYLVIASGRFGCRFLTELLRGFGARDIREAIGLEPAINLVTVDLPNIVIWDYDGKDLDALEVFMRHRRNLGGGRCNVILVSEGPSATFVKDASALGAKGLLAKPVTLNVLMSQIARSMHQQERLFEID